MGALARALLLPLLAQWLLRFAAALSPAPFTLPLQVAAATGRGAAPTPGPGPPAKPRADGLAFALEPSGGAANFLAMVDNLQGDSGRGYYLEVLIGTPPQKLQILVDTGSSNFAVAGAPHSYIDSYFDTKRSNKCADTWLLILLNRKKLQGLCTDSRGPHHFSAINPLHVFPVSLSSRTVFCSGD